MSWRWFALLPLLALTSSARADDVDGASRARAEVLFKEGSELLEGGNLAEACPKLEAAVELTRGEALGGKLVLARCYERSGKNASAWGLYQDVATRAERLGQRERQAEAQAKSQALAPELHLLELAVSDAVAATPSLRVSLAGKPLPRGAWNSRIPVDPGDLEVLVSADGRTPQSQTITIPIGPGRSRVAFDKPLETTPTSARVDRSCRLCLPASLAHSGRRCASPRCRSASWVLARWQAARRSGHRPRPASRRDLLRQLLRLTASLRRRLRGARRACAGRRGTAVFFVGAALAAGGIIMFAVAPRAEPAGPELTVDLGPAGASLKGAF
jgi:hypothetical protein